MTHIHAHTHTHTHTHTHVHTHTDSAPPSHTHTRCKANHYSLHIQYKVPKIIKLNRTGLFLRKTPTFIVQQTNNINVEIQ